jgi:hypothetical protein
MSEIKPHIQEDWWTPSQIELVNDTPRIWKKQSFHSIPGYWLPSENGKSLSKLLPGGELPEGAILDPTAWDHEHCELCWATITEQGGDLQEGYTDGKDWLCVPCYQHYLEPKSTPHP